MVDNGRPDDRPILDYGGTPRRAGVGHSAEGVAALVAGCVNALGLALLFTRKLPPQVAVIVGVAAFFVSLWGLGFGIYGVVRHPHDSLALIGLTINTLVFLITLFMGVGACCFGFSFPVAPLR